MNKQVLQSIMFIVILSYLSPIAFSQTKLTKNQIEDVFFSKEGGPVFGNIDAVTSSIMAQEYSVFTDNKKYRLLYDGDHAIIRSNMDLYLDPTDDGAADGKIVPVTMMEFPDFLGDKIRFYDTSYKIGVSPYTLDITSDQDIRFHSDTVPDLMIIAGDDGDVIARQDIIANRDFKSGGVYRFVTDSTGDKIYLWGTTYKIGISSSTVDFYSDQSFKWHSDTHSNAMALNADTGRLTLSGPLKLPVYTSLPTGETGDLIYYDSSSDNTQDGAYVKTSAGWQKL